MKLLLKTNLYYLLILLIAFAGAGVFFYFSLTSTMYEYAEERLYEEKHRVIEFIENKGILPSTDLILGDSISIEVVTALAQDELIETTIYNAYEEELLPYNVLVFYKKVGDTNYKIALFRPVLESEDIVETIVETMIWVFLLLLVVLLFFNYFILRNAWTPFYSTLGRIRSFNLSKGVLQFEKTSITEFDELNRVLQQMTSRIVADYYNMKEFTENASHEIQTPLAIIKSKLELLIQSGNFTEQQMNEIQTIYESTTRLSKLNQALILLTKIENKQFSEAQPIVIAQLLEKKLELFGDLIKHKQIAVQKLFQSDLIVGMHPALADILINNVLGNAIKHNIEKGDLIIKTTDNKLEIFNSGNVLTHSGSELFKRFTKENASSDSLGLGLAIVQQICTSYNFKVSYTYTAPYHIITIDIKTLE